MGFKQGKMIVKVQRSMNNGGKRCLIYNEDKSVLVELDVNRAIKAMLGLEMKAFFEAEVEGDAIGLVKKTNWRDW